MFKFKSKLIVAVMLVVGVAAFMSCEKDDFVGNSMTPQEINNAEICKMHNKVITSLKNTVSLKSAGNLSMDSYFENYLPVIEKTLIENDNERYSNSLNLQEYKEVIKKINKLKSSSTNSEFISYTSTFILDLKEKGYVSDYFYSELLMLSEKATLLSNEELIQYLDSDFAANISDEESNLKELIVSMAKSSDELWNETNLKSAKALKPGSSTIIADAIGALWGLPLGGVGSIIYGAAFSLYENEVLSETY